MCLTCLASSANVFSKHINVVVIHIGMVNNLGLYSTLECNCHLEFMNIINGNNNKTSLFRFLIYEANR